MTPATSQNSKTLCEQIGRALSLLVLLAQFAPADWTGDVPVYVANGNVVTDAELAERLGVSQGTIANRRRRLRALGVIGWLVAPGQGRVFWVAALNRIFGMSSAVQKPAEESAAANVEGESNAPVTQRPAENTAALIATPAASRWLQ